MRTGVLLVLAAFCFVVSAAAAIDHGRLRPPARLNEDQKVIWMGEWVACRHQSIGELAHELHLKVPAGRTVQLIAVTIAKVAERPLYDDPHQFTLAVDGCRNGILWRFYHES